MSEQTQLEMIKSFAYDMSVKDIANYYNISVEETQDFYNQHTKDIQDEIDYRKEMGMI